MSHSVTLLPSQHNFQIDTGETILAAALREKIALPYGCRDGACGACKGKVVVGQIDHGKAQDHALPAGERDKGMALFCCATARSDLILECKEIGGLRDIAVKTLPTRVEAMQRVAPDVMLLRLKLPSNDRLQFLAGQYIDILLRDGRRRSFSLANAPHDDAFLELHVRLVAGGFFTEHVFSTMKERDILRIRGPLGSFHLREDSDKSVVLIAGGTGFAPIKAVVEHALKAGLTRPMTLYWGARTRADLYQHDLAAGWTTQSALFRYVPVLSDARAEDAWSGRSGLVHRAVMQDFPDLSGHQVYACGAPAMIDAASADLQRQCGLLASDFFADSFTFAADSVVA